MADLSSSSSSSVSEWHSLTAAAAALVLGSWTFLLASNVLRLLITDMEAVIALARATSAGPLFRFGSGDETEGSSQSEANKSPVHEFSGVSMTPSRL
jgi:hypothetical protein